MPSIGPVEAAILLLLIPYVVCLVIAAQKGQWIWFALGLVFIVIPIIGLIFAFVGAVLSPKPNSSKGRNVYRQCPACAETVKREATVCRYCGTQLESLAPPAGEPTVGDAPAR